MVEFILSFYFRLSWCLALYNYDETLNLNLCLAVYCQKAASRSLVIRSSSTLDSHLLRLDHLAYKRALSQEGKEYSPESYHLTPPKFRISSLHYWNFHSSLRKQPYFGNPQYDSVILRGVRSNKIPKFIGYQFLFLSLAFYGK